MKTFPYFILFFVLASVITTTCTAMGVPSSVFVPFKMLSKFLIVMAMAELAQYEYRKAGEKGGKAILLGLRCWICIAFVSLLMQIALEIW